MASPLLALLGMGQCRLPDQNQLFLDSMILTHKALFQLPN
jgi:hypothetical protein